MTRSLGSIRTRPTLPRITIPRMRQRDASIERLGVTCFRLVAIVDGDPGDPPFWPVQLSTVSRALSAFALERDMHISWA